MNISYSITFILHPWKLNQIANFIRGPGVKNAEQKRMTGNHRLFSIVENQWFQVFILLFHCVKYLCA